MAEIAATDQPWNAATTLYLARRLQQIAAGQRLAVLDMGCGDGATIEQLAAYGHDLYGYDLEGTVEASRQRLSARFGADVAQRIRPAPDERTIPFPDRSFDVVYANQVFEHVRFLDTMLRECARVLRPGGMLLANFPLATYPIEWHLKVPGAHWLPPGEARARYLWLFYLLRIRPRLPGSSAWETARSQDRFLFERTYYRFLNEVLQVAAYHFASCEIETGEFVRAKLDLLATNRNPAARWLGRAARRLHGPALDALVTHGFNAAFCMRRSSSP